MNHYERRAKIEMEAWKNEMRKKSGVFGSISKKMQTKVNNLIPENVHTFITESVKKIVQTALVGSEFTTGKKQTHSLTLEEMELQVLEKVNTYKKTAAVEGAGTGAGGIFLGLADFPLLLTIKMKFLFEVASLYGFDVKDYKERLYILHVFQLAFSSDTHRNEMLTIMENWEVEKEKINELDWKSFQQEYRDYIDLAKMLQLVPGIGAVVGAYANYNLLEQLGRTAMNSYRMRVLFQNN